WKYGLVSFFFLRFIYLFYVYEHTTLAFFRQTRRGHQIDHRAPNGGARESTQGAKGICNPIGGTTL
ncbi:hypothetical protein, partial [Klebsiella pneumoniae]|uniref:hypothetical protein n=1 Tax=Klebsiella pneumoniae TaxID=573 RepID=UPI001D0DFB76